MRRTPTGAAMVAGVVGQPIRHSLSPLLHTAWLEALSLDAAYVPFGPPDAEAFRELVSSLSSSAVRGLNVTLPFKEEALALADDADAAARAAGAANLLIFKGGRIEARNTDGIGLVAALKGMDPDLDLRGQTTVLLGAGGAARGAAAALSHAGVRDLRFVNRTVTRAEALAESFSGAAYDPAKAAEAFAGARVVVNCTSASVGGSEDVDWPLAALPRDAVVLDMRYGRSPTAFVEQARRLDLRVSDGLTMLIEQARPSFEVFFGDAPPASIDAERLLREALG